MTTANPPEPTDASAKVAVITGASSGIGLVIAKTLARQGWRVIGLGRDPGRSKVAQAAIRGVSTGPGVAMVMADLSVMAEAARAAREVAALTSRVDVLINNAGGTPAGRRETPDGLEATFAANHLGPFLLTTRLLPLLRAAAPGARIVNVASVAHRFAPALDWDDLQAGASFPPTPCMPAPSWPTSCSPGSWHGGWRGTASGSTPCSPAWWPPTSPAMAPVS